MTPPIDQAAFAAAGNAERSAARAAFHTRRAAALAGLQEARAAFVDSVEDAYSSGRGLAERDSDALEEIGAVILEALERLHPCFKRLDVAADIAAYVGPDGRRFVRAKWDAGMLAGALAEAFQSQLSAPAFSVLSATVRLHTVT